ncbi:hypothetical protein F5Y16DRAFT_401480 [Xylariaceae sp. FL0255]|nr:hypothetical protein F5Y16DRAFT_401480 [Xylariaceae sp. FL0255]
MGQESSIRSQQIQLIYRRWIQIIFLTFLSSRSNIRNKKTNITSFMTSLVLLVVTGAFSAVNACTYTAFSDENCTGSAGNTVDIPNYYHGRCIGISGQFSFKLEGDDCTNVQLNEYQNKVCDMVGLTEFQTYNTSGCHAVYANDPGDYPYYSTFVWQN